MTDSERETVSSSVSDSVSEPLSGRLVGPISEQGRTVRLRPAEPEADLSVFTTLVEQVVNMEPLSVPPDESVRQAAALMARNNVGSVLVGTKESPCMGIVTDKDLRNKVLAEGLGTDTPVQKIMSSPVRSIEPERTCFDALLSMMRNRFHHLAVQSDGRVLGMITSHDLLELQSRSPFSLFADIADCENFDDLYDPARSIPRSAGSLIARGSKASNTVRMISALNDLVLERVLTLLMRDMGTAPAPFCWMLMGSEGRREQTLSTDQDNAIIYRDPESEKQAQECKEWFMEFGRQAVEHLVLCGYRRCPGEIMASNPRWNRPAEDWAALFDDWVHRPEPEEIMNSGIFFDFRAGFGEFDLADTLRNRLKSSAPGEDVFLRYMAADCLRNRPPLSFFRSLIVEKDGEHKNTLDIKKRGTAPLTDFTRVLALKHALPETSTIERVEILLSLDAAPPDLLKNVITAWEFLMTVRLTHQINQLECGIEPDNHIDPAELSDLDKRTLKDAFAVIGAARSYLKDAFRLSV